MRSDEILCGCYDNKNDVPTPHILTGRILLSDVYIDVHVHQMKEKQGVKRPAVPVNSKCHCSRIDIHMKGKSCAKRKVITVFATKVNIVVESMVTHAELLELPVFFKSFP